MADTVTITLDQRLSVKPISGGPPMKMLTGTINITSYSSTKAAYTQITGQFKTAPRVIVDGVSIQGATNFLTRWSPADSAVRAYSALGTEAVATTNIGPVNFIALGI